MIDQMGKVTFNRAVRMPVTRQVSFSMSDSWRDSLSCRVTATGMDFMTKEQYREYLKSDHWKELRARKIRHKRRCAICGSIWNLEVHHMIYRNIYDVETADLRVLCHRCHSLFHELVNSGKLKIKPGPHHKLFAQTRHAVLVALKEIHPKKSERVIPIEILALRTSKGGWNRAALAKLGVPWPPPKGWLKKLSVCPLQDNSAATIQLVPTVPAHKSTQEPHEHW